MAVLPTPGFADEHRIVLGAAAEHLHHAADLVFAADNRVELALAGGLGQIEGIALERLVFGLGILVGHALRAADGDQRFQDGVVGGAGALQQLAAGSRFWAAMASSRCSVETNSSLKRLASSKARSSTSFRGCEAYRPGCGGMLTLGIFLQLALAFGDDGVGLHAAFLQHRPHDAFVLLRQGDQQMQRIQHLAVGLAGDLLRLLQRLLGFLREFIESDHREPAFFLEYQPRTFAAARKIRGGEPFRPRRPPSAI